jgi:hypothetical protein
MKKKEIIDILKNSFREAKEVEVECINSSIIYRNLELGLTIIA